MDITTEPSLEDDIQVEPETCCEDPVNNHKINENKAKYGEHSGGKNKLKKLCTVLKLVKYADRKNKAMVFISLITSIANGILTPINICWILAPAMGRFIEEERHYYNNSEYDFRDPKRIEELSDMLVDSSYEFYWIAIASAFLGFFQIVSSEKSSQNILAKIKTDYLAKLLSINIAWYDKCEDQFVNTVSYDLQKMKGIFDSRMTTAIEIIMFFICGNLCGFVGSAKVAGITFVMLMISLSIIYFLMQLSKREGRKQRAYNTICAKLTAEVLGNARTVAAYGGELNEISRFEDPFKTTLKYGLKQATILTVSRGFNYFMFCICYAATFYICTVFYRNADFSPVHLVMVLVAQINVIYHSTALLNTISDLFMAMDSAYRVMAVIETESNFKSSLYDGQCPKEFFGNIKFKNVAFSYPSNIHTKVLKSLTLDIEPGKITAVVGTSGAGKSTIVGLITRLYDSLSGQITVDGVNLRDLNISWLRNQIGVVMQEPTLFDATIEENIRFGKPDATREEIEAAAKLSYAHAFINKLPAGYNSIVGERGVKLSGGQKQRIAIARALVRKPKLLLLDEATSALDTRSEEIVQEALDNAMNGRTTVIIAHRMTTVMKADVIYAMKEGEVLEKGTHDELIEKEGYYYSLFKIQELEAKDKAIKVVNQTARKGNNFEEEDDEIPEEEENVEQDGKLKNTTCCRLKNIKVWIISLFALAFCCLISAFLPGFYYVFTLLCQTFSHETQDIEHLAEMNVIFILCVGVLAFIGVFGSDMLATKATYMWLGKLRRKAFRKIVSMDISWFDKNGNTPNETLEIVINSPVMIEGVTGDKAIQVIVFFLSVAFTLVYAFFINVTVSLVMLPIIIFFILINTGRLRAKSSDVKSSTHTTKSSKIAIEYVQNVKTIQLLNCQNYVISQYQKLMKLSKKEAFKGVIYYGIVYGISKSLMRLAMGSAFYFGAPIMANGDIRGTQVVGIVVAMSTASVLAGPSLVIMSQYPAARQALNRLYRIVNTMSVINVFSDEGQKPEIIGNIVFKDVSFFYPTRQQVQVLNQLNLNIEAGKTTALVGNSGCGKSTIISLLERFYLPSGGKIIVDGVDIDNINVGYLRCQMGLVSQEPVLFDLSIKENILYGLKESVTDAQIMEAARIANIHDFIMKLPQAYDTLVGERGSKLSGGQKQRIAIARAVLRDPKILLLDEATSALDTESEKIVQEALENASVGRTTIVIAHRLSTIRKADKIAVLQAGVVVEQGTHDELVAKRGHYYNLLQQ